MLHAYQHTGASRITVSKVLGHSTIQTTMRYLQLVQGHLHEAINKGSIGAGTENGTGSEKT